jgi:hypothetical protein
MSRRNYLIVGAVAAGLAVVGMTGDLVFEFFDGPTATVLIAATTLIVGVLSYLMTVRTAREEAAAQASLERVREAEEGLERALRPATGTQRDATAPVSGNGSSDADSGGAGADQARLTLSELWAVTHRRLDHYHGIALGQAARSFRNAQISMWVGFLLLVGFTIVALQASTTAGSVVAGALGGASAALAGYVSRTFVKSQETAAGHLRAYFDQPLEFSRFLAAERLVADANLSQEQRAEVLASLVQSMIAGPPQLPTVVTANGQPQIGNAP